MTEYTKIVDGWIKFAPPTPDFTSYAAIKIIPSPETRLSLSRQFLDSLRSIEGAFIFEICSEGTIYFKLSFPRQHQDHITRQLSIYFPDFEIKPIGAIATHPGLLQPDPLLLDDPLGYPDPSFLLSSIDDPWNDPPLYDDPIAALSNSPQQTGAQLHSATLYPASLTGFLRSITDQERDPYTQLISLLEEADAQTFFSLQVVFMPVPHSEINFFTTMMVDGFSNNPLYQNKRIDRISEDQYNRLLNSPYHGRKYEDLEARTDNYTLETTYYGIYYEQKEYAKELAREYQSALPKKQPGWLCAIHLCSKSKSLLDKVRGTFLKRFESPSQQLSQSSAGAANSTTAQISEWGLVNTDELSALAHFPTNTISSDRLEITAMVKTPAPPDLYINNGVILGQASIKEQTITVTLPDEMRTRHLYLLGKSRTGKSTLFFNCILQDIERGEGVCVIDPHGDLVDGLLHYIPQRRIKETIYFNAADLDHPLGLDVMTPPNPAKVGQYADDMTVMFKRLCDTWGNRMEALLLNVCHTLFSVPGTTFIDIQTILTDTKFRSRIVSHLTNPILIDFWQNQFPDFPQTYIQPILTRMTKFLLSPHLNAILSQPKSALNIYDVIRERKILLVKIPKGEIGSDTSQVLGALLVSQIQLNAMRQSSLPERDRIPLMCYIDEFQNFLTSAFETILSEAGKFRLSLGICHQFISQLDDQTRNAIFGNVGTIITFQLGTKDATYLRSEMGSFEPEHIINLVADKTVREAICKPATRANDTFKFRTLPPPSAPTSFAKEIIDHTHATYYIKPLPTSAPQPQPIAPAPVAPPPVQRVPTVSAPAPPPQVLPSPAQAGGLRVNANRTPPIDATPKTWGNNKEKILYFVERYEYLSNAQIVELCYSHLAPASRLSAASRDLGALVKDKKLKSEPFGKSKVYYTGKSCNPTSHNLGVRDLLIKIENSNFEISKISFFESFGNLNPDLTIFFFDKNGKEIKTLWEFDAGTEGTPELVSKMNRYEKLKDDYLIGFVFIDANRLAYHKAKLTADFLLLASLPDFASLRDAGFIHPTGCSAHAFFESCLF